MMLLMFFLSAECRDAFINSDTGLPYLIRLLESPSEAVLLVATRFLTKLMNKDGEISLLISHNLLHYESCWRHSDDNRRKKCY